MVAVLASQPKLCAFCRKPLGASILALHACPECGKPQPISRDEDYFSVFGLSRKLKLDLKDVEKRFYEISRALHPDRFMTATPDSKTLSLERMSLLNRAYQTLRSPALLRDYFLGLYGIKTTGGQVPVELAESWFELQDVLMENPQQARSKFDAFGRELQGLKEKSAREFSQLEEKIDSFSGEPPKEHLEDLARRVRAENYLKSMERDMERMRKNAGI